MSTTKVEEGGAGEAPAAAAAEPPRDTSKDTHGGFVAALRVLRNREFGLFWSGQGLSQVGTWMQNYAQNLVMTHLSTHATSLGLLNFAASIPTLLLMPIGGVTADRVERRKILIYTQWAMSFLALAVGYLVGSHRLQIWHLFAAALLLGVATAYDLPAYQAFYPQLVEKEDLPQAITLNQAAFHGSRIIGPAFAGWIVGRFGLQAAFYANAVSFLPVIGTLLMIRARPTAEKGKTGTGSMMKEGFRYVRSRPDLQALLGLTAMGTVFIFPNLAILTPYYNRYVLHAPDTGLGAIMSASGVGALIGATLILSVPRDQRVLRMFLSVSVILLTMTTLAHLHSLRVAVFAYAVQSLAISHAMGLSSILIQERVPDQLRGRVMALYSMTFMGVMPFSGLVISKLVDVISMPVELQAAAIMYFVGAMWLLWRLTHAHRTEAAAEADAVE